MKKKKWMVLISVVLGGALIFGAAMANASSTSGYDLYKTALKNTRTIENVTASGQVTVNDNGKELLQADTVVKIGPDEDAMSGVFTTTIGGQSSTWNVYQQADQTVFKSSDSDIYKVAPRHDRKHTDNTDNEAQLREKYAQDIENLIDTLVGNLSTMVTQEKQDDGSSKVALRLSGNQIPPSANAAASLLVKAFCQQDMGNHHSVSPQTARLMAELPKLVDGISISNVDLKADINGQNLITAQEAKITINGQDADGNTHTIIINASIDFSAFNQTTPDTVDLTGKQVETMQRGPEGWEN